MVRNRVRFAALAVSALALGACIHAQLPVLTVRSADVTSASTSGLDLLVHIVAQNPNDFDVTINTLVVRCFIAGQDLGVTRLEQRWGLPAGQSVPIDANFHVGWTDMPSLLLTLAATDQVPYRLEGVAIVEDGSYEVDYSYESTVPRSVFLGAATRAVAPILPGGIDIRIGQ